MFCKTDNHWSELGAYFAYTVLMDSIRKDFPACGPAIPLQKFRIDSNETVAGGQAYEMNLADHYFEKKIKLLPVSPLKAEEGENMNYPCPPGFIYPWAFEMEWEVKNETLPKAVIIRDSYTQALIPLLSEHFSRSVYIWDRWMYAQNRAVISNEKPDMVIIIIIEDQIGNLLKYGNEL